MHGIVSMEYSSWNDPYTSMKIVNKLNWQIYLVSLAGGILTSFKRYASQTKSQFVALGINLWHAMLIKM